MNQPRKFQLQKFSDSRGAILKPPVGAEFDSVLSEIRDAYVTRSVAGAFRGFHYQAEPYGQTKAFGCLFGQVIVYAVNPAEQRPEDVFTAVLQELEAVVIPRGWGTATYSQDGATYAFFSDYPYVPEAEQSIDPARLGLGSLLAPRSER